MSDLQIIAVQSRGDRKRFLHLPWQLYGDDPNWIPPLQQNQKELVGFARHPFYEHADAQAFLAVRNGKPCGRVLAIIDQAHNRKHNEQRGFFGFFESVDDLKVASGLFDAARAWLAERGMQAMRGPVNPSMNYTCGLLVDGFDSPPTFMMTYNPPFYGQLIEQCGFQKAQDLYAFWGHVDMLETLDKKLDFVVHEATRRFDIKVRRMQKKRFRQEIELFLEIYNRSMDGNWGFVPLSEGELHHFGKELRHLIVPEMTTFAEVEGRAVGAVFALLDYNPRVKKINGRLFPFGFLRLLWNKRGIKRIRIIAANVLPEYQRWGVGLVLLKSLVPDVLDWGIEDAEFSWVLESNHLSRASLERGGAKLWKTYRLYDLDISS